jgi:hypothetical protein
MNRCGDFVEPCKYALILFLTLYIAGCATSVPTKPITELYEPIYQPAFNYTPQQQQSSPAGYTVGIINMQFSYESMPANTYVLESDLNKQYTKNFVHAFSTSLEKILMSKGIAVTGPFDSYEEMTYPERSRCDFLIQPTVKLQFQTKTYNSQELPEYDGPQMQRWSYMKMNFDLTATAKMEYVIYDPLTSEKLERHKITTDPITKSSYLLAVRHVQKDSSGNVVKQTWVPLWKDRDHSGAHNTEVIYGKIIDDLFGKYMTKVDGLISIEEFNHLKKYKDELKERKRY